MDQVRLSVDEVRAWLLAAGFSLSPHTLYTYFAAEFGDVRVEFFQYRDVVVARTFIMRVAFMPRYRHCGSLDEFVGEVSAAIDASAGRQRGEA